MQLQLPTWPEGEASLPTGQGIIAERFDRTARSDRADRLDRGAPLQCGAATQATESSASKALPLVSGLSSSEITTLTAATTVPTSIGMA